MPNSITEARTVACMRGNIRRGITYDAEVLCNGTQVVIAIGLASREEALALAQPITDALNKAMRDAAQAILGKYPAAKD